MPRSVRVLLCVVTLIAAAAPGPAFAQSCTPPPPGMIGWWPFDDDAGDIVGSNDGTFQDDATIAPGLVDDALTLDGSRDHVTVPDAPELQLVGTDFTVDYWIKTTDTSAIHVKKYPGVIGPGWAVGQGGAAGPGVAFWDGASWKASGVSVATGQWTHVAVVGRAATGQLTFYVDGAPVAGAAFSPIGSTNGAPLFFGTETETTFPLSCQLDEIEIFHRALEDAEVFAIYEAGSAGKCKNVAVPASSPLMLALIGLGLLAGLGSVVRGRGA